MNIPNEAMIAFIAATITASVSLFLIVKLARAGYGLLPRLAAFIIFCVSIAMAASLTEGMVISKLFSFWPEAVASVIIMAGTIAAFVHVGRTEVSHKQSLDRHPIMGK